jgi:aminoglycoside phosphotransferase (APT) family kinase protein
MAGARWRASGGVAPALTPGRPSCRDDGVSIRLMRGWLGQGTGRRWWVRGLVAGYGRGVADLVLVGSGRNADVFAIDERRVLRRYRDGADVAAEALVMTYAAALGFPVPEVYAAAGTDLVMERLDGPTLLQALLAGDIRAETAGELLASLHRQLHGLPPRLSRDPSARILHLDLHPGNVMLGRRGPAVIDWRNSNEGPPELDVALTAVILAQVAADGADRRAAAAGTLLTAFLRYADGIPLHMLDRATELRRSDPALTFEEAGLLSSAAALIRTRLKP